MPLASHLYIEYIPFQPIKMGSGGGEKNSYTGWQIFFFHIFDGNG